MANKYLDLIAGLTEPLTAAAITVAPQTIPSPPDPNDYRETVVETHLRLDRRAVPQSASQLKAMELVRTCCEYGVGLKLDPDGTLVVQSNGKAWRSLVDVIEVHIDSIAELVAAGWNPMDA